MKSVAVLSIARIIADQLLALLSPACERIIVAGSIRRECESVGDIELLAIPRVRVLRDLFDNPIPAGYELDHVLDNVGVSFAKSGERYKQFAWEGMQTDLYLTTSEKWAVMSMIRTGSAEFAKWFVTSKRQGGALPSYMKISDGQLWVSGTLVEPPDEHALFEAVGQRWVEPSQRNDKPQRRSA